MQKILRVRIDEITFKDAVESCIILSDQKHLSYICTINPEICLKAQKNKKYLQVLNKSAMNTADGIGILWAVDYLKKTESNGKIGKTFHWITSLLSLLFKRHHRTTGIEIMKEICEKSDKRIFLLGGEEGVADQAKTKIDKRFSNANIVGTSSGLSDREHDNEIVKSINESGAEILFVAFGAPKQELWIKRNSKKLKNIKLAIGVGGSFDFLAGKVKRAPGWMQKIGLEWLYRVIQEPKRIWRIVNATIIFPIKVLRENLK